MGYGQYSLAGRHENKTDAITATKDYRRMKHVFSDNSEIAHMWFHQAQSSARNPQGNFYFDGDTIYSYGSHFPIARLVKSEKGEHKGELAVLLTTRSHSVTTAKHVSEVRSAIMRWDGYAPNVSQVDGKGKWLEAGRRVFKVYNVVDRSHDLKTNEANHIKDWSECVQSACEAVIKPRIRPATKVRAFDHAVQTVADANDFMQFFGIRHSFTVPSDIGALTERMERERKLNERTEKRLQAKRDKEYRLRTEKARAEYAIALPKWIAGEIERLPHNPDQESTAYLRVITNETEPGAPIDQEVETSQGARFPLAHAVRAIALIKRLAQFGTRQDQTDSPIFVRNGHSIHLGHYQIDRIEADGTIKAGCHTVSAQEFNRFAQLVEQVQVQE